MRRLALSCAGLVVGLATGWAAWVCAGGPSAAATKVEPEIAALQALEVPALGAVKSDLGADEGPGRPLFQLTTGPSAVHEPTLRLDGLAITRRRAAALIAIDGKPAEWLAQGETRDGITLTRLSSRLAVIDTLVGTHSLALGESYSAASPPPGATAAPVTAGTH